MRNLQHRQAIAILAPEDDRLMPRFFRLDEAERLLPKVEALLHEILEHKRRCDLSARELSALMDKMAAAGGVIPPREHIASLRKQREKSVEALRGSLAGLEDTGCLLKDADIGLVDFPTLYQGREVYLCWKFGEQGIQFWHPVEDGFRGRRPVDGEFLANHKGEA